MATRGERRKLQRKKRAAHESRGTTSCAHSSSPMLFVKAWSDNRPDSTIASYCADPLSDVDRSLGFAT